MPTETPLTLVRVVAPHFVAGLVYDPDADRVTMTANILRYMKGWSRERVVEYCKSKEWKASTITTSTEKDAPA